MLEKQYHLYSVDTGSFYSNHEQVLHHKLRKYRLERITVKQKLEELRNKKNNTEQELTENTTPSPEQKSTWNTTYCSKQEPARNTTLCSGQESTQSTTEYDKQESTQNTTEYAEQDLLHWTRIDAHKRRKIKETKKQLLALLANKTTQNELTNGKDHIRPIRETAFHDTNVISVFDSTLSRTIGIGQSELTDDLIIVQVYYFDLFKDITLFGFTYRGEVYRYFTSSAGQIREKKAVFIKESVWSRIEKTVLCGLTADRINQRGGVNVNKYLACLALVNSATDVWEEFDIDKTIVVDDFETNVYGSFDLVDERNYSVTRTDGHIPIPHTDGAGMILPSISEKNFMFRAPWMKGLLGVFDFHRFVEAGGYSPLITDLYGKEHHILEEDIQIIFTKSQFKMYQYYDSWEEYKDCFKQYHCCAGICNMEEDRIKNARINYQMLQTLTDVSEEETDLLTRKSTERIQNICTSKETMMELLGITPYNTRLTPFQQAVKLYPALLSDTYTKDMIRDIKNSLLKKYRSGKLEVTGKYTFLLPDFYAACEYWFGGIAEPDGLLQDGEVFCRLFEKSEKLDCLRSPHLYKEHAIRRNAAWNGTVHTDRLNTTQDETANTSLHIEKWFTTDALYTSTHDLISKLLQFDVDGDKSLVVADQDFIRIAERNMKGVVPLYYNMRKAEPTELNSRTIYAGLHQAFTGGSIGTYSNDIAKIWNHDVFTVGTDAEKEQAVNVVKLLCMENNFCIDAAKTLYMPERANWFSDAVSRYAGTRLPAFFEYAKDKDKSQTAPRNQSLVNRIYDRIPDRPINTRGIEFGTLDYHDLMADTRIVCPLEVSEQYDRLNQKYRYMANVQENAPDNLPYIACQIRREFSTLGYSDETIADMLVSYLYGKKKRYKHLLWLCYGQYILEHLKRNKPAPRTRMIRCADCGEWVEIPATGRKKRCEPCTAKKRREHNRQMYRNRTIQPS